MDDFSWGNTRVVTGDGGRQVVVSDEGKFDPSSIPKKKWEEYQAEMLEAQERSDDKADDWIGSQTGGLADDARSEVSGVTYATKTAFGIGAGRDGGYRVPTEVWQDPSAPMTHRIGNALSLLHPAGTSPQPQEYNNAPSTYGYLPASRPLSTFELADMQQQQRQSQYLSSRPASTFMPYEMAQVDQSSDDAILAGIKEIVATADLMTVTKKSVRIALEQRFGLTPGALEGRKAYIGSATEAVLGGQL
jgi:chitin synthase